MSEDLSEGMPASGPADAGPADCDSGQGGAPFSTGHPVDRDHAAPVHDSRHQHGIASAPASTSTATGRHRRRLAWVLGITLGVVALQLVGAAISGSLALLADAGHAATDAIGVAVALVASVVAGLPATAKRTYGWARVEILAALFNGIVLSVIAVVIVVEAIARLGGNVEIESVPMLIAAGIGGVGNLISLRILHAGRRESLNLRGAYLEVFGDLLGSVAVIAAAVVILATGWNWVDQVASILIAILILPRAVSLLREVVHVLLEGTPPGFDVDAARAHMLAVPGVLAVHDVHAWLLTSGVPAFSAHVTVGPAPGEPARDQHAILDELKQCLSAHFAVEHTTLQLEPPSHRPSAVGHR